MAVDVAVILAAGEGKRMKSERPKVLHCVGGLPMLEHVLRTAEAAGCARRLVVVGPEAAEVRALVGARAACVDQPERRGTGDAVLRVAQHVRETDTVLVLSGDTPLLTAELIRRMEQAMAEATEPAGAGGGRAVLVTAWRDNPRGYGRVLRDAAGQFARIVEEADLPQASALQGPQEVNAGVYLFPAGALFPALRRIKPDNRQGEYYLVDVLPILQDMGVAVCTVTVEDPEEVLGVNDRRDLAAAEAALRRRTLARWLAAGVTVVDPATTFISPLAELGPDCILEPMTIIEGESRIGARCRIGPGSHIVGSRLEDDVRVWHSVVEYSHLGEGCQVGPFSHLRAGCRLAAGVQVGNFAEVKNSVLGAGSKVPHHSYLGDAEVGQGVNIGAGVVTVNYDGRSKHATRIGDAAFIGCNANLIAPLQLADRAYVAAGSTLTHDVPEAALAVARARQVNKAGWVERRFPKAAGDPPASGGSATKEGTPGGGV